MKSFADLGLSDETLKTLKHKGFEEPTPIQEKTIPAILTGNKDIIGQAQTGTGKTAAFGLPMIELLEEKSRNVQAIVLTPTRELAIQVAEEINSLKGKKKLTMVPIYGGQSITLQLRSLRKGVDIVVGTPGRVIDHLKRGTLKLGSVSFLVLDEADEMLNMGFLEDVETIMKETGSEKRTMLFSATMPPAILRIAEKYMGKYDVLKVTQGQLTTNKTDQIYFEVAASDKFEALCRIIDIEEEFFGIVFCKTKVDVDNIKNHLNDRGYDADGLHGDISQSLREKILAKFKKRHTTILVATDVAARGIDVQNITHVINYALPNDSESYIHRIGRTGRAGKEGNAITFITPSEYRRLQFIQKRTKTDIRKAKLPGVKEIIEIKKRRITENLNQITKVTLQDEYLKMAADLLKENEPENALAALIQHTFQGELDASNYTEIVDRGNRVVDMKGKTRLFVTQGKQDGLTPKKLSTIIETQCDIKNSKIRDVQVLDKFSFVTLAFHDAETVLAYFKNRKKGQGIFITKAKQGRSRR
ncbi:DEAD-box ATP-dependent RNA helicase DeaD (= CshA) [hydrothermal vent metagenome]|uniref:RNA helicase n=1 Tax=hydrothermal vent metagenome TaxID=652676 RepID=A0A3B1D952_9ZZZZ